MHHRSNRIGPCRHSPVQPGPTRGFTIVELLIVIIVIAVLAAVSIIAYNGVQRRARASAAQYALAQASKKVSLYQVENGAYPSDLATVGVRSGDVSYQYSVDNTATPPIYCITATSGNVSYKINESTAPTSGACPGHVQGGQVIVTNLVLNPSAEANTTSLAKTPASATIANQLNPSSVAGSSAVQVVTPGLASNEGVFTTSGAQQGFGNYSGSVYLWGSGTIAVWVRVLYTDGASTDGPRTTSTALTATPQRVSAVATFADNGKTPASLQLHVRTASVQATTYYADAFMITKTDTATSYGDGSSPNWSWNGTPNNSTSTGPAQ